MALTDVAPSEADVDDPEHVAHIVWPKGQARVTEARIMGTEVEALCGHRWVPYRDATGMPVCKTCLRIFEQMSSGPLSGA